MTFPFCGALCLEHRGTISSSNLPTYGLSRNLVNVVTLTHILMKAFILLDSD
jgi:hypothetical protein